MPLKEHCALAGRLQRAHLCGRPPGQPMRLPPHATSPKRVCGVCVGCVVCRVCGVAHQAGRDGRGPLGAPRCRALPPHAPPPLQDTRQIMVNMFGRASPLCALPNWCLAWEKPQALGGDGALLYQVSGKG